MFVAAARERALPSRAAWAEQCQERKRSMWRKTNFENVPIKPQRVYEEMNRAFGPDVRYVSTIGLSQIQAAQLLHVFRPRHWINAGQAGPLGWTVPAALGVATADPDSTVVALSGDYDFQFMIEELAVGAQFNIPYIHVLVNNAYLGLIRQSQRVFDMDYCVQLSFDNLNAPEVNGYGVDHVKVAEGPGCKAIRVFEPAAILPALEQAEEADRRAPRAGGRRGDPRASHERVDGTRDRRDHRVRGTRRIRAPTLRPRYTPISTDSTGAEMPRVVLAPDKFKGTLTAAEVAQAPGGRDPLASPGRRPCHCAGRRRRRRNARRVRGRRLSPGAHRCG